VIVKGSPAVISDSLVVMTRVAPGSGGRELDEVDGDGDVVTVMPTNGNVVAVGDVDAVGIALGVPDDVWGVGRCDDVEFVTTTGADPADFGDAVNNGAAGCE
jgi:hypothetical protein